MDRRTFLRGAFAAGILSPSAVLAASACTSGQSLDDRMMAFLMLSGGPDLRHMFPPAYSNVQNSFGNTYWQVRRRAHGIGGNESAWQARWNNDFYHHSDGGVEFGILQEAGWLNSMYADGNVALVCNAVGSSSRDHSLSERIMDYGTLETDIYDLNRSGWGGRLARAANANCISLTNVPREFCFGPYPTGPDPLGDNNRIDKSNLIALSNSREAGLWRYSGTSHRGSRAGRAERALNSWYEASRANFSEESVYHRIFETERKLREFGEKIDDVLDDCPIPDEIRALYTGNVLPGQGSDRLLRGYGFGRQMRNLYDTVLVNKDLSARVCSLQYGGWDSHQDQRDGIEWRINDLFGTDKGFDMMWRNLSADDRQNLVIVVSGEFGRQIKDNGGNGTDHGKGNIMIIIGEGVNGGVYGDMFPDDEVDRINSGARSPDITPRTEFDHVYGAVCDWVEPGSGSMVFPDRASRLIESTGMFNTLF